MTKEWQEASTEMAKEQKINPITGKSSPARDRMSDTARSSPDRAVPPRQVSAPMVTPARDLFRLDEGVDCSRVMTLCERSREGEDREYEI